MGCWNDTCFVTNLPVFAGDEVEVLLFVSENYKLSTTHCYPNGNWTPYSFTFSGKYNDYGAVEECEGAALSTIVESIRENLVEAEAETTSSGGHIIRPAVSKEKFDIDSLFEHEHDDKLIIYKKIWGRVTQSQIRHVVIHKNVFDKIIDEFRFEVSPNFPIGEKAYEASYAPNLVSFKNMCDLYDEFVSDPDFSETSKVVFDLMIHPHPSGSLYFPRPEDDDEKIDPMKNIRNLREQGLGDILRSSREIFENACKMIVFDSFMRSARRSYNIPAGAGSQSDSVEAQLMIADMTQHQAKAILDERNQLFDEEDF